MNNDFKKLLLEHLMNFITEKRRELFYDIIEKRTRHFTIILEDIFQPHNASAVLRTCDLTGIQDVHIIENDNEYEVNPEVAMGASKWLSLIKYSGSEENTLTTFTKLREQGYRIVATTPHKNDFSIESIDIKQKMAFVFGTEMNGLSKQAIENADSFVRIPMVGFTESFNISVSAAILLYTLTQKLRNSNIQWHLGEEEKTDILLEWTRRSINRSDLIEKLFIEKNSDLLNLKTK